MDERAINTILRPRLTVAHLALARGWVQGLELSDLAERYLAGLGDDDGCVDLRIAKGTLVRVLDQLAATAKHAGIEGGATLRRQASFIRVNSKAPTLDDFASTLESPDFYSEAELAELYTQKYSKSDNIGARSQARRSRLVDRQIRLITDLQMHVSAPMSLQDLVSTWFDDAISSRLEEVGLTTIKDISIAIVKSNAWFEDVRGIGQGKAERIKRFLVAQRGPLDDALAYAAIAVTQPNPVRLNFSDLLTTLPSDSISIFARCDSVPLNPLPSPPIATTIPNSLDGSQGRLRTSQESATTAKNDLEALNTWLNLKASSSTVSLYRREIERVMMWSTLALKRPFSSLSIEDALSYRDFMQAVPDAWICKKGTPIGDPEWAPFLGSLSKNSTAKALVIIQGFFSWLVTSGYATANPFNGVKIQNTLPSLSESSTSADDETSLKLHTEKTASIITRTLPHLAVKAIEIELREAEQDEFIARARFIFRLALMTGLRISEISAARKGHLKRIEPTAQDAGGWVLSVLGKRSKLRIVPLPDSLINDLMDYFASRALPSTLSQIDAGVFLVGKFSSTLKKVDAIGDGVRPLAVHIDLQKLFSRAALRLSVNDELAASQLRLASAHWLRHTCATEAVAADVPLDVVSSTLGHSNITTTSRYIHPEQHRKIREMQKFWDQTAR